MKNKKEESVQTIQEIDMNIVHYKRSIMLKWVTLLVLLILVFLFMIIDLNIGGSHIGFIDVLKAFFYQGTNQQNIAIWNIRMPRVLGAVIGGASLAIAGAVMQTCLRNPLASPSTIGISSAATFGANMAIILFGAGTIGNSSSQDIVINNPYITTLCAFLCSLGAIFLIMGISRLHRFSPESIILTGAALSALFGAFTTLIQYFGDEVKLSAAVFWTFGDLGRISWTEILIMFIVSLGVTIYFLFERWNYNALVTGEDTAKSLGVKTSVVRCLGLTFSALLTAVVISFVGMIGFIGLIGPQIVKRLIGQDHRFFIPASALAGSLILLIADILSRVIIAPVVLPVGAITAILGAPIFFIVLMKGLKKQ